MDWITFASTYKNFSSSYPWPPNCCEKLSNSEVKNPENCKVGGSTLFTKVIWQKKQFDLQRHGYCTTHLSDSSILFSCLFKGCFQHIEWVLSHYTWAVSWYGFAVLMLVVSHTMCCFLDRTLTQLILDSTDSFMHICVPVFHATARHDLLHTAGLMTWTWTDSHTCFRDAYTRVFTPSRRNGTCFQIAQW